MLITVKAAPTPSTAYGETARDDGRCESWRPHMDSLRVEGSLAPWKPRRRWLDPLVSDSMCGMSEAAAAQPPGPSLGLVRPRRVIDFVCEAHPGWTPEEQRKIDNYVNQLDLFQSAERPDPAPLEAPRMRGWCRWECWAPDCGGPRQMLLDWEFVALQRGLRHVRGEALAAGLRQRFLTEICRADNEVAFFVGNQAKRRQTFSILGVYYPRRDR